jgi:hypothetical protein
VPFEGPGVLLDEAVVEVDESGRGELCVTAAVEEATYSDFGRLKVGEIGGLGEFVLSRAVYGWLILEAAAGAAGGWWT